LSTSNSSQELKLREARRIERIFIYHRWLYVVAIGLMALVYKKLPLWGLIALAGTLGLANLVTWYYYRRLHTLRAQMALSLAVFLVDGLASWGLMLLFIEEPSAVVYAIFALIVIEGAVRYSLTGSLITGAFFVVGLSAAWIYRVIALDMSFDMPAYVFWVGLITLLSIMVGMAVREGRKQKAYAETLAAEKTLLLERRRISNELHDTVLKSLQGLAMEAHVLGKTTEGCDNRDAQDRAHYIEEVCSSMSQEIRGVVFELRDEKYSDREGIFPQVEEIVKNWSEKTGIKTSLETGPASPVLPLKASHDIRRTVSEALANVQKHSGAKNVYVSLTSRGGSLRLVIRDDGHGFASTPDLYPLVRRGKLGLVSMKERIELAGGLFGIQSGADGTVVTAEIPLKGTHA
jgi:signal transduction histidine kinase